VLHKQFLDERCVVPELLLLQKDSSKLLIKQQKFLLEQQVLWLGQAFQPAPGTQAGKPALPRDIDAMSPIHSPMTIAVDWMPDVLAAISFVSSRVKKTHAIESNVLPFESRIIEIDLS
jgi:hypothetical protein